MRFVGHRNQDFNPAPAHFYVSAMQVVLYRVYRQVFYLHLFARMGENIKQTQNVSRTAMCVRVEGKNFPVLAFWGGRNFFFPETTTSSSQICSGHTAPCSLIISSFL